MVDEEVVRLQGAGSFACKVETRMRISLDLLPAAANLAPGDLAIGVGVEADCDVEIA